VISIQVGRDGVINVLVESLADLEQLPDQIQFDGIDNSEFGFTLRGPLSLAVDT